MFPLVGRLVSRGWPLLLAAWLVLLAVTWAAAPPWDQVAQDSEFAFLPADTPSRRSQEMFRKAFPQDHTSSNIVLVLRRAEGTKDTLPEDLKFIEDVLEPSLYRIAQGEGGLASQPAVTEEPLFSNGAAVPPPKTVKRSIIDRIRTPNAPGTGALLVSADQRVLLVVVELTTELLSVRNWPTIRKVEDLIADVRNTHRLPLGMDIFVTGSAVMGRDHTLAELRSVRATGTLTVVLVIVLLILIYRAPLLALIPLVTVYLTVQVALNLLAILAGAGHITLFQGIQIYITILAYGAGVDYCIFLTARYKELLDGGATPRDAVAGALGKVGAALMASAATVICGIGMMTFARFGKFREAGFAIPLSLCLVLCATLTFSPGLLRLAGRWAFWPRLNTTRRAPTETPGGMSAQGELRRIWKRVGHLLLRRPGTVWLTTFGIMAPFVAIALLLHNHQDYNLIGDLPADTHSVVGTRVLQQHMPAGVLSPVTVLILNPQADFRTPTGKQLVEQVTQQLRAQLAELDLVDIRSLVTPLGITPAAANALAGFHVGAKLSAEAQERAALDHYTTDMGGRAKIGTRLDLVLRHSPFSRQSIADLDRLEQAVRAALPPAVREQSRFYAVGVTASIRDLSRVMREDQMRIEILVLSSVLAILIILLRRIVVSVYLLLSVLFSYYTTLGVTFAVFWLLDPAGFAGIDWKVAVFLFTILIAVGEDYNIFLMSRIGEETRRHGPVRGIIHALNRTGPVISSCGIIMAGTFGSLVVGSLTEMKQLGFALAFGVLLDTFAVRPLLVPAFLILLRTGRLSPSGRLRKDRRKRAAWNNPGRQHLHSTA